MVLIQQILIFLNATILNFNILKPDFLLMDGTLGASIAKAVGGGWTSHR